MTIKYLKEKSATLSMLIFVFKLVHNVKYMQSRRLRASNLSNRYNFEAGYNS